MPEFLQYIQNSLPELSATGLFFLFFFGTFLSEDAACLIAGTAAASGRMSFALAAISCFLGIFVGDVLLYGVGRLFWRSVIENRLVRRFVSRPAVEKATTWLENNAASAVFMSRFVTGLRLPTYLAAGALRTDFTKFAAYFLIASAIWTPILVGSTAFSQAYLFPKSALLGLVVIAIIVRLLLKLSTRKDRRLFVGRLKRAVNCEFWPIQIFYIPVVLYVLTLAVRHRSLTCFTAADPAIPDGGFKGESKHDIYRGLRRSAAAAPHMLDHVYISRSLRISDRILIARSFIDEHALRFPLVLKPDAGERGRDVTIVRSCAELETALLEIRKDVILQEFAAGDEFSIFYYRYPQQACGRIFSITEKRFPILTGDGVSTVEDLILDDPRAVALANKYFEENRGRLADIPASGENFRLIEIGTHSRGAIFLDGNRLWTTKLERKIDEICRGFDGFNFGRFDIRSTSHCDLSRGENFKIIELNGVTSESTNIYDPRYSLIDAYRILFRQWRIAFEIGAENIKLGARQSGVFELLRCVFGAESYRQKSFAAACRRALNTEH